MTYRGSGGPGLPLLVPQVTRGLPSEGAPGGPTRAVPFPSALPVRARASSAFGGRMLPAPEASELGRVLQVTVVELVSAALSFVVVTDFQTRPSQGIWAHAQDRRTQT